MEFVEHSDLFLSDYHVEEIQLLYSGYVKFHSDFQTIFSLEPVENDHCLLGLPSSCLEVVLSGPTLPVKPGCGDAIPLRSYFYVCCDLGAVDSSPSCDCIKKNLTKGKTWRRASRRADPLKPPQIPCFKPENVLYSQKQNRKGHREALELLWHLMRTDFFSAHLMSDMRKCLQYRDTSSLLTVLFS